MRRKIKIVLLTLGMIGGFASGAASMRCRREWRRESFEQHVARVCVDAARASAAQNANDTNDANDAQRPVMVKPAAVPAPVAVPVPAAAPAVEKPAADKPAD